MRGDAEDTSTRLRDVIKAVRGCKTSSEEHSVISEESARIRTSFRNEYNENRHRNVAKLIFFHMLGYNTDFGHMEVLKLIVSKKFGDKKVGYLALTQIMGEESALTLMAISSIKADLACDKPNIVQAALCAVANTASADMCRELATDVLALLGKSRSSVMPRAALAACRILRKCPELVDDFTPIATTFVDERLTQLLGTGLSLIITILKADPSKASHFATFSAAFQTSLRELVMKDSNEELDINNITDPFTQCRLLEVLKLTGKQVKQDRADLEETLAYVLTSTEFTKQTGRCVIYECCRTILDMDASKPLREQAISMLGKLLMSRENNTRFIALKGISKEVGANAVTIQSFRSSVLECVQDLDSAVARRALELIVQLVTPANIKQITSDLLTLLVSAEADMKETIARKVCMLAEMHAVDQRGYVDTMVRVLSLAGTSMDEDTISRTANIILECPQLHEYGTKMLFFSARDNLAQDGLVMLALWCIGEYADLLVFGEEMVGLPSPSAGDVMDVIKEVLERDGNTTVKMYALTALGKMSIRLPSELSSIHSLLSSQSLSPSLELQQRACEYLTLLDDQFAPLRSHLFQSSPPYEKEKHTTLTSAPATIDLQADDPVLISVIPVDEFTEEPEIVEEVKTAGEHWGGDLLNIGGTTPFDAQPLAVGSVSNSDIHSLHFDPPPMLFADANGSVGGTADEQPGKVPIDLFSSQMDLISAHPPTPAISDLQGLVFTPSSEAVVQPSLDAGMLPSVSTEVVGDDFSEVPSLEIEAYSDENVRVVFTCSKADPSHLEITEIVCRSVALQRNITDFRVIPTVADYLRLEVSAGEGGVGVVGGEYREILKVVNLEQGGKKLRVRLGVEYCRDGEWVRKEVTVDEFTEPF